MAENDETGWNTVFKLRPARPTDPVRTIVEGFRGAVPFRAFGEPREIEDTEVLVADAGSALLGVALYDLASGRVALLAVPTISRGFGAGRALIDSLEDHARRAGRTELAVSIGPEDRDTLAMLRMRGYGVDDVRRDEWILTRPL